MNAIAHKMTQIPHDKLEDALAEMRVGNIRGSISRPKRAVAAPPATVLTGQRLPGNFIGVWLLALTLLCVSAVASWASGPLTVDQKYPHLATGILQFAELAPLEGDTLLVAGDVSISNMEIMNAVKEQAPPLRQQLEKDLFFVLEQEAIQRVLLNEAKKKGISTAGGDEEGAIQALFENVTAGVKVSDEEAQSFYGSHKEMVGGAPFEQVKEGIRQYLLQDKRQEAVDAYLDSLTKTVPMRVNEKWVESQNKIAMDNPVDQARRSGKPTMVEFGATGCVPCDMMQPVLDKLRKDYPEKLNVVFVHVREEQVLAARYGIRSIPVQAFFAADGKEVFRHVGFFPEEEVLKQLSQMGIAK